MPKISRPRKGSLQFYPKKRAAKFLPSVNWSVFNSFKTDGFLGFIVYKVGMATALAEDTTPKVSTSSKQVSVPVTILEAPPMKIYSVRLYKNSKVIKDIQVSHDKELKRKIRLGKKIKKFEDDFPADYDDIRTIVYSLSKETAVKKTPDLIEVAIHARDLNSKLEFVKSQIGKEITLHDFLKFGMLDIRGLTTGRGWQGPVKRFGISLKSHKSEKGVRRPGSLGPWHPARVTFRTPLAGQLGLFTRITYNLLVLDSGKISEKNINPGSGFKRYGLIKTSYLVILGSVQGPPKRQLLLTPSFRASKSQSKKKYEYKELFV